MPYLVVQNVSKTFTTPGGRVVHALSNLGFSLEQGEILCVVGHNGSGKSTLLNCIRRAFPLDSGHIEINGARGNGCAARVVSVFQDVSIGVVPSMTAFENLALVNAGNDPSFFWSMP